MIKPKALKEGDNVGIIAPSSAIKKENIEIVEKSVKSLNLNPVFYPSCTMREGHLAGPDSQRSKDVNDAFRDPSIDGIFCIRGGYGTPRILNMIDYEVVKNNPKIFLGYSDITGLHLAFNSICRMTTLHGPMPSSDYPYYEADDYTLDSLKRALFTNEPLGRYTPPEGEELEVVNSGKCQGEIIGGNLSLLTAALGTKYEIDTKGKILFIEEVGELHYIIDRMLMSLDLNNKFKDCAGIILGTWNKCKPDHGYEDKIDSPLSKIFDDILGKYDIPIINNFRAGHITPQYTIPFGTQASMDTDKKEVVFLESSNI